MVALRLVMSFFQRIQSVVTQIKQHWTSHRTHIYVTPAIVYVTMIRTMRIRCRRVGSRSFCSLCRGSRSLERVNGKNHTMRLSKTAKQTQECKPPHELEIVNGIRSAIVKEFIQHNNCGENSILPIPRNKNYDCCNCWSFKFILSIKRHEIILTSRE